MYQTLINMERYEEAVSLLFERLHDPLMHHLGAVRKYMELSELLFPDGLDQPLRVTSMYQNMIHYQMFLSNH
jgi:hypothetical protein